jgi:hypothetical protein
MPNEQISGDEARQYMAAPNIHAANPGKAQGARAYKDWALDGSIQSVNLEALAPDA